jgi:regulator of replication initiation timing
MTDHTEGCTPLTDRDLAGIRVRALDPLTMYDQDKGRLLDEVDRLRAELNKTRREFKDSRDSLMDEASRLRAENAALAAKLEAVLDVITVKNPDWKPLTERYPEHFTPDTPEEAARKKGWKQGVDLLTQQIRAALGGDQDGGDRP